MKSTVKYLLLSLPLLVSACVKTQSRATYQGVWDITSVAFDDPAPKVNPGEAMSLESFLVYFVTSGQSGLEKVTIKDSVLWLHYADGSTDDTLRFHAFKTDEQRYRLTNDSGKNIGEISCPDASGCQLRCYGWSFALKRSAAKS